MARSRRDALWAAGLGGLLGLVGFATSLGFPVADPRYVDWLSTGDVRVHFLGWHTYRAAPWQLPLGANPFFGYPVGTSVALTDSVPVVAVLLKGFDSWLPVRFQYFGVWLLVSHVLQGAFAALLLRAFTQDRVQQLLGASLFVLAPVLLDRTGHPSLTAHWMLLLALWLHFRVTDGGGALSARALVWWTALIVIVAGTHPYLAFMVLTLMAAHAASVLLAVSEARWRAPLALLALTCVYMLSAWQFGYFVVDDPADLVVEDFGTYSMNALGPIAPLDYATVIGRMIFPQVVQTGEAYSYLGAGVLALLPAGLAGWALSRRRNPSPAPLPWWPLAGVIVTLAVMALGPQIQVGDVTVARYPEEWWGPLRVFRANGRMFWPALYSMTLIAIVGVCRFRRVAAVSLLAAAAVVQVVDVSRGHLGARALRTVEWRNPYSSPFWAVALPHYDHLVALPTNMCGAPEAFDYYAVARLAGDFRLSVNAGMAARYDAGRVRAYCADLAADFWAGVVRADTVYFLSEEAAAQFTRNVTRPTTCTTVDQQVVCVASETTERWQHALPDVSLTHHPQR